MKSAQMKPLMNNEERAMCDFAANLIRRAGFKLKLERRNLVVNVREKTSQMDLATDQDVAIEKFLLAAINGKISQP